VTKSKGFDFVCQWKNDYVTLCLIIFDKELQSWKPLPQTCGSGGNAGQAVMSSDPFGSYWVILYPSNTFQIYILGKEISVVHLPHVVSRDLWETSELSSQAITSRAALIPSPQVTYYWRCHRGLGCTNAASHGKLFFTFFMFSHAFRFSKLLGTISWTATILSPHVLPKTSQGCQAQPFTASSFLLRVTSVCRPVLNRYTDFTRCWTANPRNFHNWGQA
jgi:hypothetical protein